MNSWCTAARGACAGDDGCDGRALEPGMTTLELDGVARRCELGRFGARRFYDFLGSPASASTTRRARRGATSCRGGDLVRSTWRSRWVDTWRIPASRGRAPVWRGGSHLARGAVCDGGGHRACALRQGINRIGRAVEGEARKHGAHVSASSADTGSGGTSTRSRACRTTTSRATCTGYRSGSSSRSSRRLPRPPLASTWPRTARHEDERRGARRTVRAHRGRHARAPAAADCR